MGLIRYDGDAETKRFEQATNHGKVTYLNVIIGGEQKPYPGFNG